MHTSRKIREGKLLGDKKMKMLNVAAILIAALVLALPCPAAEATSLGTVDIVHSDFGAYDEEGVGVWGAGQAGTVFYGGVYMLDKTAGTGQGNIWPDGPIGGLCIELHEPAPDLTYTYDVVMPEETYSSFLGGPLGIEKADYLRELWGRFFDPDWVGSGPFCSQQNSAAEAFAAAVWEIIYEDLPVSPLQWDVTVDGTPCTHGFLCSDVDTVTANGWLHALDGTGPKADLRAFAYSGQQDYIVEVPEPATIALFGLGAALSLLHRRRVAG